MLIVGGGIAGSLLALVLARAGYFVTVIDPNGDPPAEFRNEKLGLDQIERLGRLGVLSCFQEACWGESHAVQPGHRLPELKDCGARYDRWVARLRAAWPANVQFLEGKVAQVAASDELQRVVLSDGQSCEGRLLVLATGRGERLRAQLGVRRRDLSARHSLCLGFSILPRGRDPFAVKARIVHGRPNDRIAYTTVFPMLEEVRVNIFSYHAHDDDWVKAMRRDPRRTLAETTPAFADLMAEAEIVRPLEIRSTDLYAVDGHVRPGAVLLGDAFHAPCPASGTGMTRILNDVDLLARVHVPAWLDTPGMGRGKIAAFYADPAKRRVDRESLRRSFRGRASTLAQSRYWRVHRKVSAAKRRLAEAVERAEP